MMARAPTRWAGLAAVSVPLLVCSYRTCSNTCACGSVYASKKPDQSYPSDVLLHVCSSVLRTKCLEPLSLSYSTKHSFVNTGEAARWTPVGSLAHRIIEAERTEHHRLKHGRDLMTLRGALAGMTDPAIHGSSSTGDPVIQSLSLVLSLAKTRQLAAGGVASTATRQTSTTATLAMLLSTASSSTAPSARQAAAALRLFSREAIVFSGFFGGASEITTEPQAALCCCRLPGARGACLSTHRSSRTGRAGPRVGPRAVPAIMRRAACRRPPVPRLGPPFPVGENRARPRTNAKHGPRGQKRPVASLAAPVPRRRPNRFAIPGYGSRGGSVKTRGASEDKRTRT